MVAYWLAGIGTLALALGTVYISIIKPWLNKPRFKIEFDNANNEPYCRAVPLDAPGKPLAYWIRLKVENSGRSVAKRCIGKLAKVIDDSGIELTNYDPVMLRWVGTSHDEVPLKPIDLNKKEYEYLDIVYTRADIPNLAFICKDRLPRGTPETYPLGKHVIQITIYGDNVNPETKSFYLIWGASDFKDIRLQEIPVRRFKMGQGQIWIPALYSVGVAFFAVSATILHSYHQFPEGIGWFNAIAGLAFIIGGGIWAFLVGKRQH